MLRGERADVFLSGGSRRSVCERTDRAVHEGWVAKGKAADIRCRRRGATVAAHCSTGCAPGANPPPGPDRDRTRPRRNADIVAQAVARTAAAPTPRARLDESASRGTCARSRAAPSRSSSAVDVFNGSEHCKTIAGVARSLGAPAVSVLPSKARRRALSSSSSPGSCAGTALRSTCPTRSRRTGLRAGLRGSTNSPTRSAVRTRAPMNVAASRLAG